jgi:hypothetical protein
MNKLQHWIITALYLLPAVLLIAIAIVKRHELADTAWSLLLLAMPSVLLAVFHQRIRLARRFNTSLLLLVSSVLLSAAAWLVYRQGLHKPTFLLEGFSAFYLSLAALALAMHKRRPFSLTEVE